MYKTKKLIATKLNNVKNLNIELFSQLKIASGILAPFIYPEKGFRYGLPLQ